MIKYAKVTNEETKECQVGTGTNIEFYKKIGLIEMEVEQAYNGQWYLKGYAPSKPEPTLEEKLEIARNDKREYDIICKKLSIAEERLAEASKFDKEFARKKLDEIELQTGKFEAENETVLKALEKAEKARSAAEADNAELAGRHALICDNLKALEEERESLRHEIEAASDDMRELEHEKNRQ